MKLGALKTELTSQNRILELVRHISPFDALEYQHQQETIAWIQSGAPIFRLQKPDIPPKHLVAYFVLFDKSRREVLLVDHHKARLWLPAGGHVEKDEDPTATVIRECWEELRVKAEFWRLEPLFLTSTITVGLTAGHTDVSLWYLLKSCKRKEYDFAREEFKAVRWFTFDEIPYERSDPHMKRFISKLKTLL